MLSVAALALIFVELFATPYVVTVNSKGCWSVDTVGLFNHLNVQGCGDQSWLMVDLYAQLSTRPVPSGASGVSIVLTQGLGQGGSCLGEGSPCPNIFSFSPPSPITCHGCVVTQLGLNSFSDFPGNLATFPFITWILLVYLAGAMLGSRRIYRAYLRKERVESEWRDITDRRKTLTTFSLGFLAFTSYQFIATWLSLLLWPVPTFILFGSGLLIIPVAIWLARFLNWKFPLQGTDLSGISQTFTPSVGGTDIAASISPQQSIPGRSSRRPEILGIVLILALITTSTAGPPVYSYASAALAPKTNLQVVATPSSFTAIPGESSNTTISVKNLRAPAARVTLSVGDLSPPCPGTCPSPFPCNYTPCLDLYISLSQNAFTLSPGQNATIVFKANPNDYDDPGDYNLIVTATPDQGVAASTLVTVHLAGFNMTADPSALNFTQNYSEQSRISIKSIYGYSGLVAFYAYPDPCRWPKCATGPVVILSSQNLTLQSNTEASVVLTVASQAQGNYEVVMTAKSGAIFRDIEIPTGTWPASPSTSDFNLTAIPSYAKVNPGQTIDMTIEVSSVNGCICIVQITPKGDLSYSWSSPYYIDPTHSANATIALTPGLQLGKITVIVTGTCGMINHSVTITLDVA